ncbi:MAG: class I tRNA ligase family protein, partial [Prolixibacteraceae bacterium]|nr:class I tRNA ligase family protein [Prolixibacteraceae bacterium]
YETATGAKVTSDLVEEHEGRHFHTKTGEELKQIVAKMSKSLKNVVNPDDIIERYGADSLRLYEMFMGPLDERKPWSETGVKGVFNFLNRVFRFFGDTGNINLEKESTEVAKTLHQTIKKVGSDIENLKFNTAISALMVLNNTAMKQGTVSKDTAETFAKLLSPFAPHLGEELWSVYGHNKTISYEPWPEADESLLQEDSFEYPVSFNGKMRFKIELPLDMELEDIKKTVLSDQRAEKWLAGKSLRKFIFVPKKIINIAVN